MYFLTTLQIKNENLINSRCVGYFKNFKDAEDVIINNIADLNETIYNYAIIENIPEGLYKYDQNAKWYKFDELNETYESCNIPDGFKHIVGLSIG